MHEATFVVSGRHLWLLETHIDSACLLLHDYTFGQKLSFQTLFLNIHWWAMSLKPALSPWGMCNVSSGSGSCGSCKLWGEISTDWICSGTFCGYSVGLGSVKFLKPGHQFTVFMVNIVLPWERSWGLLIQLSAVLHVKVTYAWMPAPWLPSGSLHCDKMISRIHCTCQRS